MDILKVGILSDRIGYLVKSIDDAEKIRIIEIRDGNIENDKTYSFDESPEMNIMIGKSFNKKIKEKFTNTLFLITDERSCMGAIRSYLTGSGKLKKG